MYHYTECGLDNVWLVNGFHIERIDGEQYVSFEYADALHGVIGHTLAMQPGLTGAELKFLRKELGLSQKALADLLGSSEQSVSLWERGNKVPVSQERLLKLIYLEKCDGNVDVTAILEHLIALDDNQSARMVFKETRQGWRKAA